MTHPPADDQADDQAGDTADDQADDRATGTADDAHPDDPCARVTARAEDGATLVACAHGGHLLSWRPAGRDQAGDQAGGDQGGDRDDVLWLSPLARCGPGEAIRGGVPVVFPQFAGRGPLPKHGFARDRAWQVETTNGARARVQAVLADDEATRAIWPHRFTLTLDAIAEGGALTITLAVSNAGDDTFSFTAALHTYLAVRDPSALVHGLEGAAVEDNAAGGAPARLPDHPVAALDTRDVAVRNRPGPVRLEDRDGRRIEIAREGFADVVVWNPGAAHGLADVPPGGAADFVCVEPAQLGPVTLAPGATWRAATSWTVSR